MAKLSTRETSPDDKEVLMEIFAKTVPDPDNEYLRNQFEGNLPTKVIELKDDVIGYYWQMMGSGNDRYVISPTLMPEHKSKMMKAFVKDLKKQAKSGEGVYKTLSILVKVDDNDEESKSLLEKEGFTEDARATIGGKSQVQYKYAP
ncbi:MAG: hypothetical protein GF383_00335 [Candidatus Lokiarchaeota archaeon]|nr:hypothetical protein [Candidatus Lokiarchaeota archaeon]MBD3337590.1 hypothetical protein [Candidatus Lokiarchaeota archaeon]